MNTSLFEIKQEFIDLLISIEENEGEIDDFTENRLSLNKENLMNKCLNYYDFMKDLKFKIENGKSMIEEIKHKILIFEKAYDRCGEKIKDAMELYNFEEIGDDFRKFKFRNSKSVDVYDISIIPKEFKTVKIIENPDKIKIKKEIDSGNEVPGCILIENKNLQLK